MKNSFLKLNRWLPIAKYSFFSLAIGATAMAATISYLGLDNDSLYNSTDSELETVQPQEEIGFRNVANLISAFVHRQRALRNLESQKATGSKEEDRIVGDLPAQDYTTRDVHRKTNGCFAASLRVSPNLFSDFNSAIRRNSERVTSTTSTQGKPAQPLNEVTDLGIFKPGSQYDAIVRFSNGHPLNRVDELPDARGFAVKILRPQNLNNGAPISAYRAEDLNRDTMLDILSINFPTFFVNQDDTAKKYLNINQHFLHGTDDFRNNFVKTKVTEGLATFASGLNTMELRLALMVNGSVIGSPLFQEYFSMVPSRLGPAGGARAVKYIWTPVACASTQKDKFEDEKRTEWPEWSKSHDYADPLASLFASNPTGHADNSTYTGDYLRKNVTKSLKERDFCFALYLQPYVNQDSTNIEDSTDIWLRSEDEKKWWLGSVVPGKLSPYWVLGHQNRESYLEKIKHKTVSEPVFAGVLQINRLVSNGDVAQNSKTCEDLSFNPWNGDIYHHKPLGVISRLKRRVYNASRRMRHQLNGIHDFERAADNQRPVGSIRPR